MRKMLAFSLAAVLLVSILALDSGASENIKLLIDGKNTTYATPPTIINNQVMVPIRTVAEALGAEVKWFPDTHTVSIATKSHNNYPLLKLNGQQTTWPYWYENGILYLEYRNAMEMLRIKYPSAWNNISYLDGTQQMQIGKKDYDVNTIKRDGFTLISLSSLRDRQAISFEWDAANGNLTIK